MKWFFETEFERRHKKRKKQSKSTSYFHKISKFLRPEFDKVLGVSVVIIAFFVVVNCIGNTVSPHMINYVRMKLSNLFYQKTFDKIASMLVVYDAKVKDKPLNFIRLGKDNDGGYIVPVQALEVSEALLGYGIDNDISFERDFSQHFDKPSFGFDCGVKKIETGDSKCHFCSECIGTSKYLYEHQTSSGFISSFSEQLQRLGLVNKKVFVKMDIEGAEFEVMDDLLKYSQNITGMVLEIHILNTSLEKVLETISSLNRNFALVHLHGNNSSHSYFHTKCSIHPLPILMELTYINKNLLSFYEISKNQRHPQLIDQQSCTSLPECEFEIIPSLQ